MALSKEVLDIIVCPRCKGDLQYIEDQLQLVCHVCALIYPVKDDIPVMIIEEAIAVGK